MQLVKALKEKVDSLGRTLAEVVAKEEEEVFRYFSCKTVTREDGSVLVAAKKRAKNKWGYIFVRHR